MRALVASFVTEQPPSCDRCGVPGKRQDFDDGDLPEVFVTEVRVTFELVPRLVERELRDS